MLFDGFTPMFAGMTGLALTAVLIFGASITKATQIAIAGFMISYMAVYDSSLMLQRGTWLDTVYVVFKALVAVGLWGGASIGYLMGPLNGPERIIATLAAFLLVVAIPWTDEAGFALTALFMRYHWRTYRRSGMQTA